MLSTVVDEEVLAFWVEVLRDERKPDEDLIADISRLGLWPTWRHEEPRNGEIFRFVTDVKEEGTVGTSWGTRRRIFRMGAIDVITGKLCVVPFGADFARQLRAEFGYPPYDAPLPSDVFVHRQGRPTRSKVRLARSAGGVGRREEIARAVFKVYGFGASAPTGVWDFLKTKKERELEGATS